MRVKREVSSWVTRGLSFLLLLNGLWVLAESLLPGLTERFDRYLIADPEQLSRRLAVLAGVGLIYFSLKLSQGKRLAWYMALLFIGLFLQFALIHPSHHVFGIVLSLLSLFGLLVEEHRFRVKSDTASLKQGLLAVGLLLSVAMAYGTIGFVFLDKADFGRQFSVWQATGRTFKQYTLLGNSDLSVNTVQGRVLLDSLDILGLSSLIFIAWSLFRPVRFAIGPSLRDTQLAEHILYRHSTSPEDFFKLWPAKNKHLFFSSNYDAFISYGVFGGVALMVDDPTGPADSLDELLRQFVIFAHSNGWQVGVIHASDHLDTLYTKHGLELLAIGSEALISIDDFVAATAKDKHFRYVRNKFTKLGITIDSTSPPHDMVTMKQLHSISDQWLQQDGRKERTFSMGYFDEHYLQACELIIARDSDGQIVAFTNLIPVYTKDQASVDIMRYSHDCPPGIMNFVYLELLELLHKRGVKKFNLGLAPLANIEQASIDNLPAATLRVIKQLGGGIFSFEGLEQFKGKFRPEWETRYIAYENGPSGIALVVVALLRAMRYKP